MEVTVGRILSSKPAIDELCQHKIPMKASVKITKVLLQEVSPVIKTFETKQKQCMKEIFGSEQLSPEDYKKIKEETPKKDIDFTKAIQEYLDTIVEIKTEKIKIEELGESAEIPPAVLITLEWLLDLD